MGDGMEDAHRATVDDERRQADMKRQKVERCVEDLTIAREKLRDVKSNLGPLQRSILDLEKELDGYLR